jgi:hypothetical protein
VDPLTQPTHLSRRRAGGIQQRNVAAPFFSTFRALKEKIVGLLRETQQLGVSVPAACESIATLVAAPVPARPRGGWLCSAANKQARTKLPSGQIWTDRVSALWQA